jgi:membrane-associated protein
MHEIIEFLRRFTDPATLIAWAGYVGLTIIIFTETGLLFGFFLPGDSLLVTAGLFAAQGKLDVLQLGALLTVAAIVGDSVGYAIGKASGPHIFNRPDSLFFNKKHLIRAEQFYEKHGGKTIIIARFMPIIRTFAPVVAGVGRMQYRRFITYNVIGGILWVWSMLLTGYLLGRVIPGIDKHIEKIIILVVFLSVLPGIISWLRERRKSAATA